MRFLAPLLLLLAAGCATAPPVATLPVQPVETSAASPVSRPSPALALLRAASHDASAPTREEVVRVLGEPVIMRQDGAGAALTYRTQTCALLLLFEADAQNAHRLTLVHASARRAGDPPPSLEQCAAEMPAR